MKGFMASDRQPLGATDILVPPMGVGAWAWGDATFWGYGRTYGLSDVRAAFQASLARGLDFIDTAESYGFGAAERNLGTLIRESGRPVIVASKFFPYPWRLSGRSAVGAAQSSLRRLGLERIDLFQLHWPWPPVPIESWMGGLAEASKRGLIRAAGISNCNLRLTRRAHAALARLGLPLASNQVSFNLIDRRPECGGLLDTCRELNVSLIAYSPLAQGLLTGTYSLENPMRGPRMSRIGAPSYARLDRLIGQLREIGAGHGDKTAAQVALNWVMCKGAIPIPGAKSQRQAVENAGALGWRLTSEEVAALDAASDALRS